MKISGVPPDLRHNRISFLKCLHLLCENGVSLRNPLSITPTERRLDTKARMKLVLENTANVSNIIKGPSGVANSTLRR